MQHPKTVANCIIGQKFGRMDTDAAKEAFPVKTSPEQLKELVKLLDAGKIRMNLLKSTLEKMLDSGEPAGAFLTESDLAGLDEGALKTACEQAVAQNPAAVADYLGGKEKALKAILGTVMKATRGRADAVQAEQLLIELIKKQ